MPWIAIAPTAGQKYEIVRVEALPRPTTDRAITWDLVTLLTLQRQSRRLALTDDLIKALAPAVCFALYSLQGVVIINRRAPCLPPLWPIEAPSIAPSFHEPFGCGPDIPS